MPIMEPSSTTSPPRRSLLVRIILTLLYFAWIVLVIRWAIRGAYVPGESPACWEFCILVLGLAVLRTIAAIALMLAPAFLVGATKRALEPAQLVCHCRPDEPIPEHLCPTTPLAQRAFATAGEIEEWNALRPIRRVDGESPQPLAASLPTQALVNYNHWAKLPRDLQIALRAGPPPRLILA